MLRSYDRADGFYSKKGSRHGYWKEGVLHQEVLRQEGCRCEEGSSCEEGRSCEEGAGKEGSSEEGGAGEEGREEGSCKEGACEEGREEGEVTRCGSVDRTAALGVRKAPSAFFCPLGFGITQVCHFIFRECPFDPIVMRPSSSSPHNFRLHHQKTDIDDFSLVSSPFVYAWGVTSTPNALRIVPMSSSSASSIM